MSSNGHLIQLKSLDQVPLYPVIKTSNVINDAHFIGVSDSGELGQVLTKTASGAKWMAPPAAPSSASDATSAFYLQMTQDNVDYGTFIFPSVNIPVAIQPPSGHYYIIQKSSVYMGETNATLDLAPYLAYQGVSSFTGTWKLYVVTGFRSDISTLLRDLSDSIASIKSSLENYYTKTQVDELLEELSNSVDLSGYYTKEQVDTIASGLSDSIATVKGLFNSYYTKSQVDSLVAALSDSLSAVKSSFSDYYTKAQINILAQSISDSIQAVKSSFNDYYTKGQVDAFVSTFSDSIAAVNGRFDSYYDKSAVDAIKGALSDSIATIKSSFQNYYNKTAVQLKIQEALKLNGPSISFNEVSDNKVTFTGYDTVPVAVLTDKGTVYQIQKGSLTVDPANLSFTLDVTPYLVYDNSQTFAGTWHIYMAAGVSRNNITMGACTGLGFMTGSEGPSFSWIDPDDVLLNGSVLAKWNQTVLVRKAGNEYPESVQDGTVVATTARALANKNYYRDHSFVDAAQGSDSQYSYMLFSQADNGAWNNLAANRFSSGLGLSWYQVQQFVRAGRGAELFPVGTVFYVDHTEYTHQDSTGLWFRVAGHDQVPAADETLTHSMCLEMVDCLFAVRYDAAELEYALTEDTTAQANKTYYTLSGSTYTALTEGTDYDIGDPVPVASWYEKNLTGRSTYGSNNPKQNNVINWLNSNGTAGNSIQPMTIWDQCGSTLLNKNGFLKYIDPLFLAVVQPAKLTTAICTAEGGGSITHTAKFWLLSKTQLFGTGNGNIMENTQLDYYKNGGSKIKMIKDTDSATAWWLRSTYASNAISVLFIKSSEEIDNTTVSYSFGISPACIIA